MAAAGRSVPRGPIRTVAIVGAGNGGCAAAADLTLKGYSVRLWGRSQATIAPILERGALAITGVFGDHVVSPALVTNDVGEAVGGAELVLLMGPTHAHERMADTVAPHLQADQVVMAAPGHTLLLVPERLRRAGAPPVPFCDTATLPYIARKSDPTTVRITQTARHLVFAACPAHETEALAALIRPLFPHLRPARTLLDTAFPYTNAIHHPPAVLLNVGRIEHTAGDYFHYYDGITPAVGRLIDALDRERLAVAAALRSEPLPFIEQFFRNGYTTAEARETGLAYEAFHQSEPDRWIRAPASLDHRFLNEDVPFGLVLLEELGRLAGVPTPGVTDLIHLACLAAGRDFRRDGLTLERAGLGGLDLDSAIGRLAHGLPDEEAPCRFGSALPSMAS